MNRLLASSFSLLVFALLFSCPEAAGQGISRSSPPTQVRCEDLGLSGRATFEVSGNTFELSQGSQVVTGRILTGYEGEYTSIALNFKNLPDRGSAGEVVSFRLKKNAGRFSLESIPEEKINCKIMDIDTRWPPRSQR